MKRLVFGMYLILVSLPLSAAESQSAKDWKPVEEILGKKGMAQGDGLQVVFPRTDLNVVVEGVPLEAEGDLVSWFLFKPLEKGTQLTGKVFLLDTEVPKAMAQALKNGLEIAALYGPFLNESPAIQCLVVKGKGARSSLAWAAKLILSSTDLPDPPAAPPQSPSPASGEKPSDWAKVQSILGLGKADGRVLQFEFQAGESLSLEMPSSVTFQKSGGRTSALGEFVLKSGDENALVEVLLRNQITVTTLHRQGLGGEKGVSILDFWVTGPEEKIAEGLKEALDEAGLSENQ